ncbi:MAG: 50S ribosomal protein L1 [Parcubacteria group bacterium CG1_02_37_51]|uniref:Large ribosomal subunit protein uL1 n=2 Tax=Candidatus Komeiliibacteriota TaxID=1817908 RepID=A0A2M8DQM8_9BACT|nr:MAG: 50S ribosomal protein L1 [Parcubacteria group bacterium CG1_02_37_51]PIY95373.1 MAG: 50S ribosomal protein L1 [Candidatus Komeilibacteria bacterium CG_4_10_14_0_8_um_filter_37_78]PJC01429.1 MAG: 50S ribosomal protein L1 [Candidatus Komeilibacteria bacterium CG_4_9_14_0_8_um_filter_36_9]
MSKRMTAAKSKIDRNKKYSIEEAIKLVKETGVVKFDATVELHANLNIDQKKSDQQLRGTIKLPHGTGKNVRVAAFVSPDKEKIAKEAGAVLVGGEELIAEIKKTGKTDFDIAIATPDMMAKLSVIAKVLGQKGLMPNPKAGTITADVKKVVADLNKGLISLKNDATGNVHSAVGKVSFTDEQLSDNINTFIDELKKMKPEGLKGSFIKTIYLTSSMGPGIGLTI